MPSVSLSAIMAMIRRNYNDDEEHKQQKVKVQQQYIEKEGQH